MRRFEEIGVHIMNRTSSGGDGPQPDRPVLADRDKRRMVAQIIGQAYMKAHHLMLFNKDKVEHIADVVIEKKELYGDELVKPAQRREPADPRRRPDRREVWPVL